MTAGSFHSTRWTLVLRARGDGDVAKAALSDLCAAYYDPVILFLQRDGRTEDQAREVAHDFFETLLTGGLGSPDPARGRFRSYLLGALKHFLMKRRASGIAEKRGGGAEHVPFESGNDFGSPDDTLTFDRTWALSLIARSLEALEVEQAAHAPRFAILKPWLGTEATGSQADAARDLGMSETAVKVAIHRLRARFREIIRTEIAATVADPADAADELRHLIVVASAG